jgi:hypothetical protein
MPDYNNPDNRLATLNPVEPQDETYGDMLVYFIDLMTANKPQGFTIITRSNAQGLPAGVYRIGSYWEATTTASNGRVTISKYRIYTMANLPTLNDAPTKLKQWIEGKGQQVFQALSNITGIPFGPKDFGFFKPVQSTSNSGETPADSALDDFCLENPDSIYCPKPKNKKIPWVLLAIAAKFLLF